MRLVLETKIADYLDKSPTGLSTEELSSRTGVDEDKLCRILRTLATCHMFKEGELDSILDFPVEKA